MPEIALYEAKNKLSGLLDEVAAGKEFTITRHGKPAARLVSADSADRAKAVQSARALFELRKGATLGGLSIKELINEGRP